MTKFNTTINNDSPLITYYPTDVWHPGSPLQDIYAYRYAQGGTFTLTNATSASATINFNGTAIWVYGSKRPNHSAYQATFDGTTTTYDGRGDELNQQVIFSATDLNSGPHTVSMANLGSGYYGYLDIDYVIFETDIGDDSDEVTPIEVMLTETSQNFTLNGSGWKNSWSNSALGTSDGMYTEAAGNSLMFTFTLLNILGPRNRFFLPLLLAGSAVSIYGSIGPSCGFFDVQIDGGAITTYNATRNTTSSDQLLFFGSNFGSGDHTIQITNNATNSGILGITRATVQRATDSFSSDSTTSQSNKADSSNMINTALVGALSAVIGLLLVSIVAYFLYRRRRRQQMIPTHIPASKLEEAFSIDPDGPPPPLRVSVSQTSLGAMYTRHKLPSPAQSQSNHSETASKCSCPTGTTGTGTTTMTAESGSISGGSSSHRILSPFSRSRSPFKQLYRHGAAGGAGGGGTGTGAGAGSGGGSERITSRDSSPSSDNESTGQQTVRTAHVCKDYKTKHKHHHHHHHHCRHHRHNTGIIPLQLHQPADSTIITTPTTRHLTHQMSLPQLSSSTISIGSFGSPRPLPQRPLPLSIPPHVVSDINSQQQQRGGSSISKFRRRSFRNSRILRTGYNVFFARAGSSISGSAYAPSTVLTSEISERPATTLSPLTEVPPAPPPIPVARPSTPTQPRPLLIANQSDD